MYKNLNARSLGVSGRQSELIELALTYKFSGFDVEIFDYVRRADKRGIEHAARFVESAQINVGGFNLPFDWADDQEAYKTGLAKLDTVGGYVAAIGARRCLVQVPAASDSLPYHEHFELLRARLAEMADVLAKHDVKIAVGFHAAPLHRKDKQFEFIHQAEGILALVNAVSASNVGLLLDTWNWHIGGGSFDDIKDLSIEKIVAVRIADCAEGVTAEDATEQHRLLPGETGVIEVLPLLKTLLGRGYDGPVAPCPNATCFSGMTRESIVNRAADSIEKLWIEMGLSKPLHPPLPSAADDSDDDDADGDAGDDKVDADEANVNGEPQGAAAS